MTAKDESKAGIYVADEDGATYTAPLSYGGRVTFNGPQNVNNVSEKIVEDVIKQLIASGEFSGLFSTTAEI